MLHVRSGSTVFLGKCENLAGNLLTGQVGKSPALLQGESSSFYEILRFIY